jgi:quercetin dioxygenase-like cupin family protein
MRFSHFAPLVVAVFCLAGFMTSKPEGNNVSKARPLILEKGEGERRVWRVEDFQAPFILKVDPRNGGSRHMVFGTEDLAPGETIPTHKHPGSDEILFLQNGVAKVHLDEVIREVHGGTTVFIPSGSWISVTNVGSDPITTVFVFSSPGFEDFMRAASVREGEKMVTLSQTEADAIAKTHSHAVIYKEP